MAQSLIKKLDKIERIEVDEDDETSPDNAIDEAPELERFSGASLTDIPNDVETRGGDEGVYVSEVRRLSKAARAGLIPGDIIRKVNRKDVKDLKAFEKLVKNNDGPLALSIERRGSNIFVAIR